MLAFFLNIIILLIVAVLYHTKPKDTDLKSYITKEYQNIDPYIVSDISKHIPVSKDIVIFKMNKFEVACYKFRFIGVLNKWIEIY